MKTNKTIITILSIALFLSACQSKQISPEQKSILQEIQETAETYNSLVEKKIAQGEFTFQAPPLDNAVDQYAIRSNRMFHQEYMKITDKLYELNEKYYLLVNNIGITNVPLSYPNSTSTDPAEMRYGFQQWLEEERKTGSFVEIYSETGEKIPILIGESYVQMRIKMSSLILSGIDPVIPEESYNNTYNQPTLIPGNIDTEIIQKIEGRKSYVNYANMFVHSGDPGIPMFDQVTYQTDTQRYYTMDASTHEVIAIDPFTMPDTGEGLSLQELETLARDMVSLAAPGLDLDTLTPEPGSKISNYFYRWTDHNKQLADGSPPYIQIGLTGKGELLSYINLIPLAK